MVRDPKGQEKARFSLPSNLSAPPVAFCESTLCFACYDSSLRTLDLDQLTLDTLLRLPDERLRSPALFFDSRMVVCSVDGVLTGLDRETVGGRGDCQVSQGKRRWKRCLKERVFTSLLKSPWDEGLFCVFTLPGNLYVFESAKGAQVRPSGGAPSSRSAR